MAVAVLAVPVVAQNRGFVAQSVAYCAKNRQYVYPSDFALTRLTEATAMTIRRSIALLISAAALLAAAACSSPTAPHGCDVVTSSGSSAC
jgi:hypothetical protein